MRQDFETWFENHEAELKREFLVGFLKPDWDSWVNRQYELYCDN